MSLAEILTFDNDAEPSSEHDYCSRNGSHILAERIRQYWSDRGYIVEPRAVSMGFHPSIRAARYDVRSDMVNGMPVSALPSNSEAAQ